MGMGRPGAGESIARAMQIIEAVGDLGPGATSREIADRLDLPPANIYRLLNTLAVEEYLVRTADLRGFALGNRLNTMVHSAVTPYMSSRAQELCEKFRASVRFGVYVMHFRPATLRIVDMDPDHPLAAEHEMIRSLHASAAGKLLLAADSQWRELLPPTLPALTQSTVVEMRELAAQVEETRQRGYAVSVEEMLDGEASIAVPILDVEGVVRGAVTVKGFSARLDAITSLVPRCRELAAELGPLLY